MPEGRVKRRSTEPRRLSVPQRDEQGGEWVKVRAGRPWGQGKVGVVVEENLKQALQPVWSLMWGLISQP